MPAASLLERGSPKRSSSIKMLPLCWRSQRLRTETILGQTPPERWNAPKINIAAAAGLAAARNTKKSKKFAGERFGNPLKRKQLVTSVNLGDTLPFPWLPSIPEAGIFASNYHAESTIRYRELLSKACFQTVNELTIAFALELPHRFRQTIHPAKRPASPP